MGHPAHDRVMAARSAQERVADAITTFAGSMTFIYLHAAIFAVWCATGLFGVDSFPFNLLTLTVSLEAIFLSTFVMIGQNRQSTLAAAKAAHDYDQSEQMLARNTDLTETIHDLTAEIHRSVVPSQKEPV